MDPWNFFKNTPAENSAMDFAQNFGASGNRFMNGHSGGNRMGNSMNSYGSTSYNSSLGSALSSMSSTLSQQGMSHFGTSNSLNSNGVNMTGPPGSYGGSNNAGPPSPYGLGSGMPPSLSPNQHSSVSGANGFNAPISRNRYSNYYDHPSMSNGIGNAMAPPARNSGFPPPPGAGAGAGPSSYYNSNGTSSSGNMFSSQSTHQNRPMVPPSHNPMNNITNYYSDNSSGTSNSSSSAGAFPPIGEFKIDTFSINANGQVNENGMESGRSFTSNGVSSSNGASDSSQNVRETGIIEKLLQTYGFIQCCERQARLFFHFSQFDGNTDHLRIGDPVEFEVTFDRRTGKPIASTVQKISPEVVLSEERVVGAVTTELVSESGGEQQGRISYENRGECFFLPYGKDDVEGYVTLKPGDKVSFQIATNQRTGNLAARHVRLENPVAPVRYQGVVSAIKDAYGFIERADVVDEIYFHVAETKHIPGGLKLGDDVDFCIAMSNGKEVAVDLVKLQDGSVVFEDTSQDLVRGQVLKTVERSPRHNPKEPLPGRIRYRGEDRSEVEVKFGERDQRGEFTLRHGDWVEFNIATDRRDKLQKATNITLLDESFQVSGERRVQGEVHLLQENCGYIRCCDRDLLLHFHYRELLDPNLPVSVGDELEFTVGQDSTLTGSSKQTATRIAHLEKGTVINQLFIQADLLGQIIELAKPPLPIETPTQPGSIPIPKDDLGVITYVVDGQKHNMEYLYNDELANVKIGDKVKFSVFFNKRLKKLCGTNVTPYTEPDPVPLPVSSPTIPATVVVPEKPVTLKTPEKISGAATEKNGAVSPGPGSAAKKVPGQKNGGKANKQVYQGFVAALKESFGFIETLNHDKEIFFHFSNVENGESAKLELGDEVEYTLSSRSGPGGKISAENISPLSKGTLKLPKALETVHNGFVIRPIRSSNPDQPEYCGLLAIDTDDVERSEQYQFGITGVVNKRELLQKNDSITFQVDESGWATNITAVRKKLISTVDTVKGPYGFLNYEAEEGKKLFFHQTEVKDKAPLSPGDEVEFVIITNQKTGKSSACSIARIMPAGGQSKRPQRLISQLKTMSQDQSKPRIIVLRQPKGPDSSKGFAFMRSGEPTLVEA